MVLFAALRHTESAGNRARNCVEHVDDRREDALYDPERANHTKCGSLRRLKGQGFGHHLPKHNMQIGHQADGEHQCRAVGRCYTYQAHLHPVILQQSQEPLGDGVFAIHAQPQAGQRNAQLRHDDKAGLPACVGQNPHYFDGGR